MKYFQPQLNPDKIQSLNLHSLLMPLNTITRAIKIIHTKFASACVS